MHRFVDFTALICGFASLGAHACRLLPPLVTSIVLAMSVTLPAMRPAKGAIVNFWLSNSDSGPETPVIDVLVDTVVDIDVFARPPAGMILTGFSLNLVAEQQGVISFQSIEVHNPPLGLGGSSRYQIVFDSAEGLLVDDDRIDKFFGASFLSGGYGLPHGGGVGPNCADAQCIQIDGLPAWRVATVSLQAIAANASTELYLEIGEHGLTLAGDAPAGTDALFGVPAENPNDVHQWSVCSEDDPFNLCGNLDQRFTHLGLPDAVINVVTSLPDADFDDDDDVDGFDFLIWQRGFGSGAGLGDANGDGVTNAEDLAIWQTQYGIVSSGAVAGGSAVPEPSSLVLVLCLLCTLPALGSRQMSVGLFHHVRLHGRDGHGIDDIWHRAASTEVVDWFAEPL